MTTEAQAASINTEAFAKLLEMIMSNGGAFKDAFQISDAEMDALYARGYELQKQRKFGQALKVFEYLCYLNHYEESYWIALGYCREQEKRYQKALQAYMMAGYLDVDSPIPPLRSAECLMHMGQLDGAKHAAEMAASLAGDTPRFKQRRERAEFLLKTIQRRQSKQGEKN